MREKPLILITDDEQDIREIIKIKLTSSGFDVAEGSTGMEAVQKAKELKPDLIILDVVMPEMDGVTALMKLKEDPETKDIRVVLFTGKGDPRPDITAVNQKFAAESGAVDFMRKEIDLNELITKLKKDLGMNQ